MKTLPIGTLHGNKFGLPLESVTEKLAFLGRTGSGKTYGATKLAELMMDAGVQIIALDPVGVWRGLRMGGNYSIYIFGGLSGDFPLEPTAGTLIADLIVDRGISAVLDVSQFEHDSDKARFATAFADRFYFRKKASPSAVHIFIEEAQEFIPQNCQKGEERMLHAFQRMWKLGRNFGIGGSLISQRPADVSKKALNQTGTLFVFQLTGPHERKAVEGWISDQGVTAADLHTLLPQIKVGQPHVWSPTFLNISDTILIGTKKTADISSTPKPGQASIVKTITAIDGEKLKSDMAATVERAKENDPTHLKNQVAALKRELAKLQSVPAKLPEPEVRTEYVDRPVISPSQMSEIKDHATGMRTFADAIELLLDSAVKRLESFAVPMPLSVNRPFTSTAMEATRHGREIMRPSRIATPTNFSPELAEGSFELKQMHRKMLTALAQHPDGLTKSQILIHTSYAASGTVSTAFAELAREDLVVSNVSYLTITKKGLSALGKYEPLPTGNALQDYLMNGSKLSTMEKALLGAICRVYPSSIGKGQILLETEYAASGTVSTAFARLVAYGYAVKQGSSMLKAAEQLFDA